MSEPTASAPPGVTTADSAVATASDDAAGGAAPPGYDLLGEIGHGGMGVVYRGRDRELNREVAVKILLVKYATDSATAKRFVAEAQITGQLQHPGVPPVYRVGTLPDGRPFLAMKLIQGQTLDVALKKSSAPPTKWLGVFEGVCQAVGFAHAHGVIHRDLKPANVMVGTFGEVQVMDWGLAKVLLPSPPGGRGAGGEGDQDDPESTAVQEPPGIKSVRDAELLTQYGSVLGTPAYMAPEQAIGAIDQIDRRTDVFGLGAILCAVLTGKPPFVGDSAESTRQMAARAKLTDAHTRLDGCGAEPDLVALCKRCLAAEPADRPADGRAVADAVHRLRVAADERAHRAEIDRERAEVEGREYRKRRRVLLWAGGVMVAVLLLGVIGTSVGLVQAAAGLREADEARAREAARADAEAVAKEEAVAAKDEAVAARKRAIEFRDQALDALRAATGIDVEQLIGERQKLTANERAYLEAIVKRWRKFADQGGTDEQSRAIRAEGHFRVGILWDRLGRRDETRKEYEQARDLQSGLAADFPDNPVYRKDLARTHGNLGHLFHDLGEKELAKAEYDSGERLLRQLADRFPDAPEYQKGLAKILVHRGVMLAESGKLNDARTAFESARDQLQSLADRHPDDADLQLLLGKAYHNVGMILRALNERDKAMAEYERSRDTLKRLADRHPTVADYQSALADAHLNIGSVLYEQGRRPQARAEFERVCEVRKRLADQFPGVPEYQLDLGGSYNNLGVVIRDGNRPADSLPWFDKAVAVLRPLYQSEPRDVTTRRYLKNTHLSRAVAFDMLRRYAEAVADWDQVVELTPKGEQPKGRLMRAVSRAHAGQTAEAIAEAAEIWQLTEWDGGSWYDLARVYALAAAGTPDKKEEYGDKAVEAVRKAIKAGFTDVVSLKIVSDLNAIRDRDDFKKLIADLEGKRK